MTGAKSCCCSGFDDRRREAIHHGPRVALPIFPQQGVDPLPPPERREALHVRSAARHAGGQKQAPRGSGVRTLVHAFLRSACEEAPIRGASQPAPLCRDAPEAIEFRAASADTDPDMLKASSSIMTSLGTKYVSMPISRTRTSSSLIPPTPGPLR
ncbi:hypothetical protein [Sphingobium sp. SYK-6]|uniref:hypothetical protein n=1 Tax=Sphingobium sp. (strain NBRC 103272 / SYK-6) TaxID=627192 RepID=UPI003FA7C43A